MAEGAIREGGCACGAVRFRAEGKPLWVAHCHCTSCRRQTASPFTTYAGYRPAQVSFGGTRPACFASSKGVKRSFCAKCGTPISFEGERWPDELHLFVGAFDDPNGLAPSAHVFTAEQLAWVHLADKLPRFAKTSREGPPP